MSTTTTTTAEANRKLVLEFYTQVVGEKNFANIDKYVAPNLIEHNPDCTDGSTAWSKTIPGLLADTPKGALKIHRTAAEGDLVWLHCRLPMGGVEYAIADIFRVENGKIVEHWDICQEIPKDAGKAAGNSHPFF